MSCTVGQFFHRVLSKMPSRARPHRATPSATRANGRHCQRVAFANVFVAAVVGVAIAAGGGSLYQYFRRKLQYFSTRLRRKKASRPENSRQRVFHNVRRRALREPWKTRLRARGTCLGPRNPWVWGRCYINGSFGRAEVLFGPNWLAPFHSLTAKKGLGKRNATLTIKVEKFPGVLKSKSKRGGEYGADVLRRAGQLGSVEDKCLSAANTQNLHRGELSAPSGL